MKFHRINPSTHYRSLRLASEDGCWELGLSHYSHGMRLRMGRAGCPPRVMDFCLGRDPTVIPKVLIAVLERLAPLDENCTAEMIDSIFPWSGTRPDLAVHIPELLKSDQSQLAHPSS